MKYLKKFENDVKVPDYAQIGDYVLCDESNTPEFDEHRNNFLTENIGQLVVYISVHEYPNLIRYENIIENEFITGFSSLLSYKNSNHITGLDHSKLDYDELYKDRRRNCRPFSDKEIIFFSPNKKEVEDFIEIYSKSKKFNL